MTAHPVVVFDRCPDYQPQRMLAGIDSIVNHLDLPVSLRGLRVLLKPNLISSRGPGLACTHPVFLAAVALWFHEQGAKLSVGDSPAFGTTSSVMARQGMTAMLASLPVKRIHFQTPVARQLDCGVTVDIAAEALECDLLVNLPKLKAHGQMYLTGAVKNFFGLVVGMRKAMIHMRQGASHRQFAEVVLALHQLLPAHLSLVDGVEAMHRSGPLDGDLLKLGCLGGSQCPVALDTGLLELLELDRCRSPLWLIAMEHGYQGARPEEIRYPMLVPADFQGSGFVAPEALKPIRFNPLRLLAGAVRRFGLAIRG